MSGAEFIEATRKANGKRGKDLTVTIRTNRILSVIRTDSGNALITTEYKRSVIGSTVPYGFETVESYAEVIRRIHEKENNA